MTFQTLTHLPPGFLDVPPSAIQEILPTATLIHLSGQRSSPVFVSILQHGNEDVGLKAVQKVLHKYHGQELPRSLSIFVANVKAATRGVRILPDQPDYNRVWPGSELPSTPEHKMMAQVVDEMRQRQAFLSIDLHNNTGTNPLYACVCSIEKQHLHLASLFSRTVVYFTRPKGVQTQAFMPLCPSITCECGKVGDETGVAKAAELLDACLHLKDLPNQEIPPGDLHLFHTVAIVKVPQDVTIGFGDDEADLVFPTDLDHWNFSEVGPGAEMAYHVPGSPARLIVLDETGRDVHDEYISISGNSMRLKKKLLPSMLTLDEKVIRQDCLCYFMERMELDAVTD